MAKYEAEFKDNDIIVTRVLEKAGDTFEVDNRFLDHIGTVTEGEVVVTREDGSTFTLKAGDSTPVNVGDKWKCIATQKNTVTECSLPANDGRAWKEIGLSRDELEKHMRNGKIAARGTHKVANASDPNFGATNATNITDADIVESAPS